MQRNTPSLRQMRAVCVLFALAGCAPSGLSVATPPDALPRPFGVLYLIGDAGDATEETPVLRQLSAHAGADAESVPTIVAFLGDNIYEDGLRDADEPGFANDSIRLEVQVDVLRGTRAHGIFVPGNHDWENGGSDGLARMINQTAFVARRNIAGTSVEVAPADGCPGPFVRDLAEVATIVLIDTHWWLHDEHDRTNVECDNQTEVEVLRAIRDTLETLPEGRRSVVLAHHPLQTYGEHGGYFSTRQVFFPLTELVEWLYVPIPLLYPIARNAGWSDQDMSGGKNVHMRESLESVFKQFIAEPMIFGAGHEHTLQVFDGTANGVGTHVVSGAGSKLSDVLDTAHLDFASGKRHAERGYMKLEFYGDGTAQLFVYTDGTACREEDCPEGPVLRFTGRLR